MRIVSDRVLVSLIMVLMPIACLAADNLGAKYDGTKNRWKSEVESADKIVIRTCGVVSEEKAVSHVIMEIDGRKQVSEFLKPFGLFGQLEGAAGCGCHGDPSFEVYKEGRLVTTFAIKHGMCIYWPDAWPHEMFPASQKAIDDLFVTIANKGYPCYMHSKEVITGVMAYVKALQEQNRK